MMMYVGTMIPDGRELDLHKENDRHIHLRIFSFNLDHPKEPTVDSKNHANDYPSM